MKKIFFLSFIFAASAFANSGTEIYTGDFGEKEADASKPCQIEMNHDTNIFTIKHFDADRTNIIQQINVNLKGAKAQSNGYLGENYDNFATYIVKKNLVEVYNLEIFTKEGVIKKAVLSKMNLAQAAMGGKTHLLSCFGLVKAN